MGNLTTLPKTLRGGVVLLNSESSIVKRVVALQYTPGALNRSLQIQNSDNGEGGDRSQAFRIKGAPVETIKLEAEIDAADQLEEGDKTVVEHGVHSHLAALESIVYPGSDDLISNNKLSQSGTLEIIPMEMPLTLFVWGKNRILPVRLTELSITEEAFDPSLNPLRAKVSLGMRVLTVDDLGFNHKGGSLFMNYLQQKENLREKYNSIGLNTLGIGEIP